MPMSRGRVYSPEYEPQSGQIWAFQCPRHPNRETAFNAQRGAYFCGRCGAWYGSERQLLEQLPTEEHALPTPQSALGWPIKKPSR